MRMPNTETVQYLLQYLFILLPPRFRLALLYIFSIFFIPLNSLYSGLIVLLYYGFYKGICRTYDQFFSLIYTLRETSHEICHEILDKEKSPIVKKEE